MRRSTLPLAAAFVTAALFVACQDQQEPTAPDVPDASGPSTDILDGAHGGNEHFYFLPSMVKMPSFSGIFNPLLEPFVKICLASNACVSPVLAEVAGRTGNHYGVRWKTSKTDAGEIFRVKVYTQEDGDLLGFADVELVKGGPRQPNSSNVRVNAGSALRIRFRIEIGAISGCELPCLEALVDPEEGGKFILTENGVNLALADFPPDWSPGGLPRIFKLACDIDAFFPEDGPLPTNLIQRPLFCDYSLAPPLDEGEEFGNGGGESPPALSLRDTRVFATPAGQQPVTVRVGNCIVDESESGMDDYHAAEGADLQLAKNDPSNGIELLDPAAVPELGDCEGNTTPIPVIASNWGKVAGPLGWLAARVFAVGELNAAALVVRDGGVGGRPGPATVVP